MLLSIIKTQMNVELSIQSVLITYFEDPRAVSLKLRETPQELKTGKGCQTSSAATDAWHSAVLPYPRIVILAGCLSKYKIVYNLKVQGQREEWLRRRGQFKFLCWPGISGAKIFQWHRKSKLSVVSVIGQIYKKVSSKLFSYLNTIVKFDRCLPGKNFRSITRFSSQKIESTTFPAVDTFFGFIILCCCI